MSVDQFPDAEYCIIDGSMVDALMNKTNKVLMWCNAGLFVQLTEQNGFFCMFISEIEESICYGFNDIDGDLIDESNYGFSSIVSKYINEPMDILYQNLMIEYGVLAENNAIARFNLERLYLNLVGMNIHPEIMGILEVS